jgi:hypothetical protein
LDRSFSNQPVLETKAEYRRSTMMGHDVAGNSEQPEQILRRWGNVVDTAPRHQVDLGDKVLGVSQVRCQRPTYIAVYPRDALVVEDSKLCLSIVT